MTEPFTTPEDLAEMFGVDRETILRWRKEQSWPSLKVGKTIRFTAEHVAQIVRQSDATAKIKPPAEIVVAGQTARSAKARRSA